MRAKMRLLGAALVLLGVCTPGVQAQADFDTSLHATRAGKETWYGAANGGFESFTGVPIEELGCVECHGPNDANGNPNGPDYEPGCADCHATQSDWSVDQNQCLSCHGRQKKEIGLGYSDVHRDAGMVCWDCHTDGDLHGDGMAYDSMLEPGAIDVDCVDCHTEEPAGHQYDWHHGKLHCTSCHAQTVTTCYNCHFESQLEHVKRPVGALTDFVILGNRDKDGKVYPMTFQSLTNDGTAFAAFGPFTSHTITKEGARECKECHLNYFEGENEAIEQYNATGEIKFAEWDEDTKTLTWMKGVIPLPYDYNTSWKMDFLTYIGDPSDPVTPDKTLWAGIGKDTWDGQHLLYGSPLSRDQMEKLGFRLPFDPDPGDFATSLHATRVGKDYWYGTDNGGFETLTGVPIEDLGCVECHGPNDANGNPNGPDYEPGCSDCHATQSDWSVDQNQCLSCHGRQKKEIALGYTDVHRDAGMVCWDCHSDGDVHGDGMAYDSMLEPGAIDADCLDCHEQDAAGHPYDWHEGKLHCTSCHAQTVTTCYNCHFESQLDHVKRAMGALTDFVILGNRHKDGKIYPMTFQSLTNQGDAWSAFGPFTSHTVTREGRTCSECHLNFYEGENEAIEQYNDTGEIKFLDWDDDTKTFSYMHGIIPMPFDYETSWKMDYLTYTGDPSDPVSPDKTLWSGIGKDTWDGHQMFFIDPMTEAQMAKLGFDVPGFEPLRNVCGEDLNHDQMIDQGDLGVLLASYGIDDGGDIDGDGDTDQQDLGLLLASYGRDCR